MRGHITNIFSVRKNMKCGMQFEADSPGYVLKQMCGQEIGDNEADNEAATTNTVTWSVIGGARPWAL